MITSFNAALETAFAGLLPPWLNFYVATRTEEISMPCLVANTVFTAHQTLGTNWTFGAEVTLSLFYPADNATREGIEDEIESVIDALHSVTRELLNADAGNISFSRGLKLDRVGEIQTTEAVGNVPAYRVDFSTQTNFQR